MKNALDLLFAGMDDSEDELSKNGDHAQAEQIREKRNKIEQLLHAAELEEQIVTVETEQQTPSMFDMLQGSGMEQMGMNMQDAFSQLLPTKKIKRKLPVKEARKVLIQQEAQKMIDMEEAQQEAVHRAEQAGIIFIDEIDKVVGADQNSPNVSREGVQDRKSV